MYFFNVKNEAKKYFLSISSFNRSILNPDVATLVSTHARSRPREGESVVHRDRPPLLPFLARLFVYLLEDETAMSYIRDAEAPTAWPAPLSHRFLATVIFSRYFIRFAPKPVKADHCANSRSARRARNLVNAPIPDLRPINSTLS